MSQITRNSDDRGLVHRRAGSISDAARHRSGKLGNARESIARALLTRIGMSLAFAAIPQLSLRSRINLAAVNSQAHLDSRIPFSVSRVENHEIIQRTDWREELADTVRQAHYGLSRWSSCWSSSRSSASWWRSCCRRSKRREKPLGEPSARINCANWQSPFTTITTSTNICRPAAGSGPGWGIPTMATAKISRAAGCTTSCRSSKSNRSTTLAAVRPGAAVKTATKKRVQSPFEGLNCPSRRGTNVYAFKACGMTFASNRSVRSLQQD